jgi:Ca2+-binding RTX toxin-like protein
MALQYDAPTTGADFSDAINSNVGISASTAAAISTLLGLDNEGSSVVLAGWDGVGAINAPADQPVDVLAIKTTGAAGTDTNLVLPESVADAKVIIIDSETNVSLTVTQPVVAEARAFALAADTTVATDLVINGGNGNDKLTYVGTANVTLDGGNGNDVLITGSGSDVVTGGVGNNHIETGAGDDIINTGLGNDVILAGAGRDLINVAGASTDYTVDVTGSFLNLTGTGTAAGTSAIIQGGEFVSFNDGNTLAIVETDAEASALRLFEGLLGRDVDNASAEFYSSAVQNGASLNDIASSFLASSEYKTAVNGEFLSETYLSLLGRSADDSAQTYWQDQLASGKTQAEVAALISTSAEAQANGQSNDDFISSLYTNALGRGAVAEDTSYWVGALIGGSSRADVAASIYSSTEAAHHANAELIDSLYTNALGRDNVPDTDAGKAAWIAAVDNGTLTQADAVIGIVGSPEGVDHNTNVVVVHGAV